MLYDPIHKLLCSFPRVIADLLRGYVGGNLVPRLDFKTLDPAPTEQVSDRLERKLSDSVWRVQCDDGQWVWVYVVVEFQSRPDPGMGLRMLAYVALQYLDLQRQRGSHERVPAVLGAVLYSGEEAWVEELDTRSRISLQPGSDVECMLPHLRFPVIHERREGRRKVPRGNAAGLMFRLWGLERQRELLELVAQVRSWLAGEADRQLRAAFEWLIAREVIPAYFPEESEMRQVRGLANIERMLRGNVVPFSQRHRAIGRQEGLAEGLEQGREEGLETIRSLHVRTARVRFGEEVAEQLAALLRPVRDLRLLGEVGDIVILAASGDDLLLRVTGLLEAGPGNGDLRA